MRIYWLSLVKPKYLPKLIFLLYFLGFNGISFFKSLLIILFVNMVGVFVLKQLLVATFKNTYYKLR